MAINRFVHSDSQSLRFAMVSALVSCVTVAVLAIDKDKAVYRGGSISGDYQRAGGTRFPAGKERPVAGWYGLNIAGRLDIASDSGFVFDAGRNGFLTIRTEGSRV